MLRPEDLPNMLLQSMMLGYMLEWHRPIVRYGLVNKQPNIPAHRDNSKDAGELPKS